MLTYEQAISLNVGDIVQLFGYTHRDIYGKIYEHPEYEGMLATVLQVKEGRGYRDFDILIRFETK
jgi:hypothetical protein